MSQSSRRHQLPWPRYVLIAAGCYNLLWGAAVMLFPGALFRLAGMEEPRYLPIWQCVGMIVGVYGVGYLIASRDPIRHWPITLVGLLGKIFGPIGFAIAVIQGQLPPAFGITIVFNDLIWWLPFAAILYQAFKASCDQSEGERTSFATAISTATSQRGATLSELSRENPTLVVFLRHSGCTFCRETLEDLSHILPQLESRGVTVALVHMSEPMNATKLMSKYNLDHVHRFSDPSCDLYRSFGVERGRFLQLFGPKVWARGIVAALKNRHGVGPLDGDGFRMPGAFLLRRGSVLAAFRAQSAADRPDYLSVACGNRPCPPDSAVSGSSSGANATSTAGMV